MKRTAASTLLAALAGLAGGLPAQSFVNFESPVVSPIRISADGLRLFAVHTAADLLCVYSLENPRRPVLLREIPVGLEPVSVHPRTDDEVWVVDHVSDAVSVVSLAQGRVIDTLPVADEPSDVVFAGGRAFVTAAASDRIQVFDAVTRAPLASIDVFGKDPRHLAVDASGTRVFAVIQRSGNGTTSIPDQPQTRPPGSSLPTPPRTARIVRADDPAWAAQIPYTLPDQDVFEIDATSLAVTRTFRAVGTTNTGIAVHPTTGDLWVTNTEARNLVAFEPNLRGHAIDSRVTRITTGAQPTVTPIDLNPGIDYSILPNPAALGTALAEPYGIAIHPGTGRIYVAAQGTDRVGVLDGAGRVTARIEIGGTPGALVDTRHKRGPRGLALRADADVLYVWNKLSASLSVVDVATDSLLREIPLGSHDPTPQDIRDGRRFLYDAKLSGNGTMSCASCHVDGDIDGLSWDLGDPMGSMQNPPRNTGGLPFSVLPLAPFHPMKGAMATQTLKGLDGVGPLHWRGDQPNFQAFNRTFDTLMGGTVLSGPDIALYTRFATTIAFPPNPHQQKDRTLRATPAGRSELDGQLAFDQPVGNLFSFPLSCNVCHTHDGANPTGTNGQLITAAILQTEQQLKVAQLRNMYRKVGFERTPGPKKAGFGFTHDGAIGTLEDFLALPVFGPWRSALGGNVMQKIVPFLMVLDTGTAPAVGLSVSLDATTVQTPANVATLDLLIARAAAGDLDLVAHGTWAAGGELGALYDTATRRFVSDTTGGPSADRSQLLAQIQSGSVQLTFRGVPPGTGARLGRDRDLDGTLDGDARATAYGNGTAGCGGVPSIRANAEAELGSTAFAFVGEDAAPQAQGVFLMSFAATSQPLLGLSLLVDLAHPIHVADARTADARGTATYPLALPSDPGLDGLHLYAQFVWLDACGPAGLSATAGVDVTLRR